MTDERESQRLGDRLRSFGYPHESFRWGSGEVDYVQRLGLTAADVPELLAIARQWLDTSNWPEDESDVSLYASVHAWRALAQLRAKEAIGPLLDLMDPLDAGGDDWYLSEFPIALGWIGPASLAPAGEYLRDERHTLYPRVAAANALCEVAQRHPEAREDAVRALCDALAAFEQNDYELNAFIIYYLVDLKATEAAELIERAYQAGRVDETIRGDWEMIRRELNGEPPKPVPQRPATDFAALLAPPERRQRVSTKKAGPTEVPSPVGPSKRVGRNDPCPCGSGKKYKKCCGR